jgi:TRAP transporter TAXI family solute receptor
MGLYPETITLMVTEESGIRWPSDLLGKRIDMGLPSSGRFASISRLFELLGIQSSDFKGVFGFTQNRAIDELCQNTIDATLFIAGHPNSNVARAIRECRVRLIPFEGPGIEEALATSADYQKTRIPWGTYPELPSAIISYAVYSTVVTRADVDPALVETVVTRTLENLDALSVSSPVLAGITADGLRNNGLTAPLHPGAERAYSGFNSGEGGS